MKKMRNYRNKLVVSAPLDTINHKPQRMSELLEKRIRLAQHTPPHTDSVAKSTQSHADWASMSTLASAAVAASKERVLPPSPRKVVPGATFTELGKTCRRRKRKSRDIMRPETIVAGNRALQTIVQSERRLAREQNECAVRAINVSALGVVRSIKNSAARDGLIGVIASTTDLVDACGVVRNNAEELLTQLEAHGAKLMRTVDELSIDETGSESDGVVALVATQMHVAETTEAICAMRNICSLLVERDTKASVRERRVEYVLSMMARTFAEYFEPAAYGLVGYDEEAAGIDEIDQSCPVCSNAYESGASAVHRRVRFDCCNLKQSMCAECLMRSAYTQTKHGCEPTFSCSFCRTSLPLYTTAKATEARELAGETLQRG